MALKCVILRPSGVFLSLHGRLDGEEPLGLEQLHAYADGRQTGKAHPQVVDQIWALLHQDFIAPPFCLSTSPFVAEPRLKSLPDAFPLGLSGFRLPHAVLQQGHFLHPETIMNVNVILCI